MDYVTPLPDGYNDGNRAFLQAFMARGTLTLQEGQSLLAAIISAPRDEENAFNPEDITMDHFQGFIAAARDAISPLDLDIRRMKHQKRNETVWALINTHSDPSTQLATTHSADEISYIKRLLDAMFETYNTKRMEVMCVTEAQAIKLARPPRLRESDANGEVSQAPSSDRGLKHSEVLALLSSLVQEGWLEKSRHGFFSLSPRSLMELWSWLIASYNDQDAGAAEWQRIKFCEACKEMVTVGQRCSERDCNVRLHNICQEAFWRARRERKCPKCGTDWEGQNYVGEKAVTETAAFKRAHGQGRASGGRRSGIAEDIMAQNAEENEVEDDGAMQE